MRYTRSITFARNESKTPCFNDIAPLFVSKYLNAQVGGLDNNTIGIFSREYVLNGSGSASAPSLCAASHLIITVWLRGLFVFSLCRNFGKDYRSCNNPNKKRKKWICMHTQRYVEAIFRTETAMWSKQVPPTPFFFASSSPITHNKYHTKRED